MGKIVSTTLGEIDMDERIRFGHLSTGLKIAVVLAWISGVYLGLIIIAGFFIGLLAA